MIFSKSLCLMFLWWAFLGSSPISAGQCSRPTEYPLLGTPDKKRNNTIAEMGLELTRQLRLEEKIDVLKIDLKGFYVLGSIRLVPKIYLGTSYSDYEGSVTYSFGGEISLFQDKSLKIDNRTGRLVALGANESMIKNHLLKGVRKDVYLTLARIIDSCLFSQRNRFSKIEIDGLEKVVRYLDAITGYDSKLSNEERLKRLRRIKLTPWNPDCTK